MFLRFCSCFYNCSNFATLYAIWLAWLSVFGIFFVFLWRAFFCFCIFVLLISNFCDTRFAIWLPANCQSWDHEDVDDDDQKRRHCLIRVHFESGSDFSKSVKSGSEWQKEPNNLITRIMRTLMMMILVSKKGWDYRTSLPSYYFYRIHLMVPKSFCSCFDGLKALNHPKFFFNLQNIFSSIFLILKSLVYFRPGHFGEEGKAKGKRVKN